MDKIKVVIRDQQKEVKIPTGIRMLVRRCCNAVLLQEQFPGSAEVDVTFVDGAEIRRLNKEYRNKDAETDVLSFPLGENGQYDKNPETGFYMLGDVIISMPRAVEQAEEYGHSLQREVAYLTTHSVLHLLGYDHEEGGMDAVRMREKEENIMNLIGLPRDGSYYIEEN